MTSVCEPNAWFEVQLVARNLVRSVTISTIHAADGGCTTTASFHADTSQPPQTATQGGETRHTAVLLYFDNNYIILHLCCIVWCHRPAQT